jgi:IS5 family transposase
MRKAIDNQLYIPFDHSFGRNKKLKKYEKIESFLRRNNEIYEIAHKDLTRHVKNPKSGAKGLTAEQVVHFLIAKSIEGLSYRDLEDAVNDSVALKRFCKLGLKACPKYNTISTAIKLFRPATLKKINDILVSFAKEEGIEKGRKVRTDTTTVESNIHFPTDNSLIWDCVRVANRVAGKANDELFDGEYYFPNRTRIVKKLHFKIINTKGKGAAKKREVAFKKLIGYGEEVLDESKKLLDAIVKFEGDSIDQDLIRSVLIKELHELIPLFEKVLDQTKRRIFDNEKLPPQEKIVSIFEPHTDILKKGDREVKFGHKICLTGGASGMILDCMIERGNPNDATLFPNVVDRQIDFYEKPPLKISADGGFYSIDNATYAKERGIRDVVFTKSPRTKRLEFVKSSWVFKQLRNFRAGVEAIISMAKRCFGLDRCNWKGWESFQSYVWSGIISYNLNLLSSRL